MTDEKNANEKGCATMPIVSLKYYWSLRDSILRKIVFDSTDCYCTALLNDGTPPLVCCAKSTIVEDNKIRSEKAWLW